MTNALLQRTTVTILTNKSGGAVAYGDVVILGSATAKAFTTTTTEGYNDSLIGVVIEPAGIANNADGKIAIGGWVPKINLDGAATLYDFIKHDGVAKQGTPHAAPAVEGDFAMALQASTTPEAVLMGAPNQGGGGGAPTTAEYITTASDGTLGAEVVIPGLAGSPDIAGAGGAGTSEEYDTSTTGITFDTAITTVDSDTTAKSHLYMLLTGDTNTHRGTKAWAPAGAFDARMKISLSNTITNAQAFGLLINDNASADGNGAFIRMVVTPGSQLRQVQAYTYASGTPTQQGGTWTVGCSHIYFRITRDGSNNVSFYFSTDGLGWQLIATQSHTFTPSRIGYSLAMSNSGDVMEAFVDWLRTSV